MLIALAWPSHVHHQAANGWFEKMAGKGWATCPLTQCAFVRISANPKIIPEAVTPQEALDALEQIVDLKHHNFWPDSLAFGRKHVPCDLLAGYRQVTDAYLLALAIRHKGRLVTMDSGIASLLPPKSSLHSALEIVQTR